MYVYIERVKTSNLGYTYFPYLYNLKSHNES